MGRRLKRKPRGRQGVERQHRKASEIFKDNEKAACTREGNRNAAAGKIGAVGDVGRETERGVIWVSGSLKGRLEGYLKNKKQPALIQTGVQAAFHTPTTPSPILSSNL